MSFDPVMHDLRGYLSSLDREQAADLRRERIAIDLLDNLQRPHCGNDADAENVAKSMHGAEDEAPALSFADFCQLIRHALREGGLPTDELYRLRRSIEAHADAYARECEQ